MCRVRARIAVVQIAMTMPVMEPDLDATVLENWARAIDQGPFSSLCWVERIAFGNPENLTLLGALAAWTNRVRLLTTVIVPQLHDPVMLAKASAAGDMLCGGACLRSAYGPQLVIFGRFWRRWVRAGHVHIPNADQRGGSSTRYLNSVSAGIPPDCCSASTRSGRPRSIRWDPSCIHVATFSIRSPVW